MNIANKATRTLNFIKRHLSKYSSDCLSANGTTSNGVCVCCVEPSLPDSSIKVQMCEMTITTIVVLLLCNNS